MNMDRNTSTLTFAVFLGAVGVAGYYVYKNYAKPAAKPTVTITTLPPHPVTPKKMTHRTTTHKTPSKPKTKKPTPPRSTNGRPSPGSIRFKFGTCAILRVGSTGTTVRDLQRALWSLGLYTDGVDGIYGHYTEAAVKALQSRSRITVDGVFGPQSASALNHTLARYGGYWKC